MRTKIHFFAVALGLTAVLGIGQEIVEEIVAIVNDDVITFSEFKKEYDTRALIATAQVQGEQLEKYLAQVKSQLMDMMITDKLLLQLAKEKNLNVTESVKNAVEKIKKENNFESDDDLKRALLNQGLEWDSWLKQLEEDALRQTVVGQEVNRLIVLDDAEVVDYYRKHPSEFVEPEDYTVRAIYLTMENIPAADLEAKKKEIDEKLKSGTDFAETSGAYSDAPLKETKGSLGTLKKGELEKNLQQGLDKLKKGETSPWIQAKAGWYLLKMEDKKDSRLLPFETAKPAIEQKLYEERQAVKLKEFLDTVKKRSYIKILKPNPLG
jgi:peptidyl-prolyl cis-trans isomerase SurA